MPAADPCSLDRVRQGEALLGVDLPQALRDLYLQGDGWYNGVDEGEWWVIWPLVRLVEETANAWRASMLSRGLIAFGDDGTGNPFCMSVEDDDRRDEVVHWSWIDGDVTRREGDLSEFRQKWCR